MSRTEKDYEIDIYVNGKQIDYFDQRSFTYEERLEHVKDWAKDKGITDYLIVSKNIDYWYVMKFQPAINKFIQKRKIYLVQICTIAEIEERFKNGRIA